MRLLKLLKLRTGRQPLNDSQVLHRVSARIHRLSNRILQ